MAVFILLYLLPWVCSCLHIFNRLHPELFFSFCVTFYLFIHQATGSALEHVFTALAGIGEKYLKTQSEEEKTYLREIWGSVWEAGGIRNKSWEQSRQGKFRIARGCDLGKAQSPLWKSLKESKLLLQAISPKWFQIGTWRSARNKGVWPLSRREEAFPLAEKDLKKEG